VYPTSAGGAAVDSEGLILGLVAAGLSRSSVIAITRPTIERVAEVLSTRGHMPRGYLGVGLQQVPIPQALRQQLGIQQESGVMLLHVAEDGPAGRAGLLMGDVLLSLGSKRTETPEDLHETLGQDSVNKSWLAQVLRGGALQQLNVTVGERQPKRT
jgi:S1-C subfamily serine protease